MSGIDLFLQRGQWGGHLTIENCEAVAKEIERRIGNHLYTYVTVPAIPSDTIYIRTDQYLRPRKTGEKSALGVRFSKHEDGHESAGFTFSGTYGIWFRDTEVHDADAMAVKREKAPYIVLDHNIIRISENRDGGVMRTLIAISETEHRED